MNRLKFSAVAALLAIAPLVAACDNTAQDNSVSAAITAASDKVKAEATQLQQITAGICGYVPEGKTAIDLIGTLAGWGGVTTTLTGLAQEFCNAVTAPGARKGGVIRLRGVALKYHRA